VWDSVYKLFDDEGVNKKLEILSKYDTMLDDSRNPLDFVGEEIDKLLEVGKCYRFKLYIEEVGEDQFVRNNGSEDTVTTKEET
jgi:hypothetical protein